jgi:hypothetical protein
MNSILKFIWNFVFKLTNIDISFGAIYRDWSFYLVELRADYQKVTDILSKRHLKPKEVAPGETRIQIVACDMKDVQILGSYHEVSIQVPVDVVDASTDGQFAHLYLPVTTEAARWAGVDITGFPKFIAQIDIEKEENRVNCRLGKDDEPIMQFGIENVSGDPKQLIWDFYGTREGKTLLTTFKFKGLIYENQDSPEAMISFGSHPLSGNIKKLLLSEEVVRIVIGNNLTGDLNKPLPVEQVVNAS